MSNFKNSLGIELKLDLSLAQAEGFHDAMTVLVDDIDTPESIRATCRYVLSRIEEAVNTACETNTWKAIAVSECEEVSHVQ